MEKFTFFWGGIFSNWYNCSILIDNVTYNCVEHYMMAQKAILFKDAEMHAKIMSSTNPKDQKKYGRKVKNFDVVIWQKYAKDIVYKAVYSKFIQHQDLKKALLGTAQLL